MKPCTAKLLTLLTLAGSFALAAACGSDDSSNGGSPGGSSGAGGTGGADADVDASGGSGGTDVPDGSSGSDGGDASTGACVANATESCDCTQGTGSRRCAPDASGWSACECTTYGAEYAVSPTGSDTATGSPDDPFATLGRAKQAVADLVAQGVPSGGVVVWVHGGAYVLDESLALGSTESGTATAPVVWRGVPGESARILGGKPAQPADFSPVPATSPVYARLDPAAQGHVVQLDLSALGITDYGELERRGFCRRAPRSAVELFVAGQRMPLARWPDASENTLQSGLETGDALDLFGSPNPDVTGHYVKDGTQDSVSSFTRDGLVGGLQFHLYRRTWDYQGSSHTAWFVTTETTGYPSDTNPWWYRYDYDLGTMQPSAGGSGDVTTQDPNAINHGFAPIAEALSDTTWRYAGDRPSRWSDVSDLRFHGFWKYAWADCHVQAASIDTATRTVTFTETPGYGIEAGQPWYAYNIPEEITEPGEWWLDRSTGIVYLWPPAGFDASEVVFSSLADPVVRLNDAAWVELRDLSIEAGRAELVRVEDGSNVSLVGLSLLGAGTDAVVMSGAQHRMDHCHVAGVGNGGVRVSGGDRPSLTESENVIEHSHFEHFGQWEWTYRPAVNLSGAGNVARNNLIHDAPHSAILYGGNENTIELNEIHNVCEFSSDAGAIYAGRDWGARGNVIRHNFIHDVATNFEGYGVHGIYLDDCLSGIRVEGNVLYRISGHAIQHGGGRDDLMVNNVIARCGDGLSADKRGIDWLANGSPNNTPGDSWNLLEKLQQVGYQDEPWASRYPECAAIPNDWNAIIDPGAQWLYPEGSVFSRNVGYENNDWIRASAETLAVYAEQIDNLEDVDPKFVDEANLDLSLQPDSPAYDLPGFEEIPFGEIGIAP